MHAKYEPYLAKHVVRRSAHRQQWRRRGQRQTNHDCIGSRPTFCREPKRTCTFSFQVLHLIKDICNTKILWPLTNTMHNFKIPWIFLRWKIFSYFPEVVGTLSRLNKKLMTNINKLKCTTNYNTYAPKWSP